LCRMRKCLKTLLSYYRPTLLLAVAGVTAFGGFTFAMLDDF